MELYDFYFSETRYKHPQHSGQTYFKGQLYTEMITTGKTPVTNHLGDLVFLGTGTMNDCTFPKMDNIKHERY